MANPKMIYQKIGIHKASFASELAALVDLNDFLVEQISIGQFICKYIDLIAVLNFFFLIFSFHSIKFLLFYYAI
jgi:hypothetical protein